MEDLRSMTGCRCVVVLASVAILAGLWPVLPCQAQGPTIQETALIPSGAITTTPGSLNSLLGLLPGSSGMTFGSQPGRDDLILSRAGVSGLRVPAAITMPGGTYQGPQTSPFAAAPAPLPAPRPLLYGTLELPREEAEAGPPNGLTLDQAIDRLVRQNLDLQGKQLEIPQARADVLTASLRANPIFFADSQLIPYGSDSIKLPDGPTQYDINVSHPLDYSHKRWARMAVAARALEVMEAQYQNEVRLAIQNLYNAFVDVLAAQEAVRYLQTSVKGLDEVLRVYQGLYDKKNATSADVDQANSDRQLAVVGLLDAEQAVVQRKLVLGELINLAPEQAERLELRGTIADLAPPPPSEEELIRLALASRPDVAAFRLGVASAEANVGLQRANRFADAYLLYQPWTWQNNAPYRKESGASWAIGITVPMPVYNRNQGNIERAKINVYQSQVQLAYQERRVAIELQQAIKEYRVSGQVARKIRTDVMPSLERAYKDRLQLFQEGEVNKVVFLDSQRKYNEMAKAYLDAAVRHRRSMLNLNTVIGQRIMP
jgi:cobalt-zinc-cadmium efflux system outer membrane protein